jgi:hemoglobin
MRDITLFEAMGGDAAVLQLAHAWHERVLADDVVAHAFRRGVHPQHAERLAAYWAEAWGGPPTYSQQYGTESSVVRMHSGNGPHDEMNRRAIACFARALDDVGLVDADLRAALHAYFTWATETAMDAYPTSKDDVPADLRITRWSWDGPEGCAVVSPTSGSGGR